MKEQQVRLSYITFASLLEELMAGPCTAKQLSDHTGMGHRYMCRLVSVLHAKKLIHISGWDKASLGRCAVRVYSLGHGKDQPRKTKPRSQTNKDYKMKVARAPLMGTPFYGLGA